MSIVPTVGPAVRPAIRGAMGYKRSPEAVIRSLFSEGQQGFWLPFTDFASLSQDSAGTLPYTALEQPVGRVLDRSGRGNHASQATSTARGAVSARVNLLDNSEFAGNSGVSTGSNYSYSTLSGYLGAVRFALRPSSGYAYKSGSLAAGLICVFSVVVKMDDGSAPLTAGDTAANDFMLIVNGNQAQAASTVPLGGGLYRLTTNPFVITAWNTGIVKYASNSAKSFTATAYSLVPVAQASLPYQRVNTTTDYDAVGFPKYLRLDGTDDFYTCAGGGSTTGFYYSDVIRPTSTTFSALIADYTASGGYLVERTNTGISFIATGGGTTRSVSLPLAVNAQAFVRVFDDGVNLVLQVNEAQTSIARPAVTAGSATMYLGRYPAIAQYFSGSITEPIYRAGPPPNAYERDVIRNYQMQKAGML